jgi:hypothetical protein
MVNSHHFFFFLIKTVLKEIDAYDNLDFSFFKAFFDAYFNL